MGVFSFLRRGIQELSICRDETCEGDFIFRYPATNIPNHAQVTVNADEVAVLFRGGQIAGKMTPGRHTIKSDNLAFLNDMMTDFMGDQIFITELIWVLIVEITGNVFSTSAGNVADPKTGAAAALSVSGAFAFKKLERRQV